MPWELESVNVHLVELDEGYMLIDSGVGDRGVLSKRSKRRWPSAAFEWSDIRMLCLTHLHPDHIGLSWKILELTGARLVMHRAEAEYLDAGVARKPGAVFRRGHAQSPACRRRCEAKMERAMRDVRRQFRTHQPDWILEGGETHSGARRNASKWCGLRAIRPAMCACIRRSIAT